MTGHDHAVRPSGQQETHSSARGAGRDTARPGSRSLGQGRSPSAPLLVGLQRTAGNRAVTAMLSPAVRSSITVQRDSAAALIDKHTLLGMLDEEDLAEELAAALPGNTGLVNSVLDLLPKSDQDDVVEEIVDNVSITSLSPEMRIRFIQILQDGAWVTDKEEGQIALLWQSFGPDLAVTAARYDKVWAKSVRESDQLNALPMVLGARAAFPRDVLELARVYLGDNAGGVRLEAEKLGIRPEEIGAKHSGRAPVPEPDYLLGVLGVAHQVAKIQRDLRELRSVVVGTERVPIDSPDGTVHRSIEVPATFNPHQRPQRPNRESPTWEEVNEQYQTASAVIRGFANVYPSIYVLLQQDRLDELTNAGSAEQAKSTLRSALAGTLTKIDESRAKLGGSIGFEDLIPLHGQLFAGKAAAEFTPTHPWGQAFYRGIAEDLLKDEEAEDFWTDLGLNLVGAAALIAAPFTGGVTLGVLLGLGIGIGAGQAARSWNEYSSLATASAAGTSDELSLVSEGQVTAALTEAVINSLTVFLDVYGARAATTAGRTVRGAATQAAEREAREQLVRAARREVAQELAGAGASAGLYELGAGGAEDELEASAAVRSTDLGSGAPHTVSRLSVQRSTAVGTLFEDAVVGALSRGEVGGIPPLDYIFKGQYNAQGHGIDAFGFHIDPAGRVRVYHFEMKYRSEGSTHGNLPRRTAGYQTSRAWTAHAVDNMFTSQHDSAVKLRQRLKAALTYMYPGDAPWNDVKVRHWLRPRLVDAQVSIFVPSKTALTRIGRQVGAFVRWGRRTTFRKLPG